MCGLQVFRKVAQIDHHVGLDKNLLQKSGDQDRIVRNEVGVLREIVCNEVTVPYGIAVH